MEPPIMKPKILDSWTMARMQQPARAYKKFFNSRLIFISMQVILAIVHLLGSQKPFNYTDSNGVEFPAASDTEGVSERYRELLAIQKRKYGEWVMCPSKFEVEPKEPAALNKQTKVFKAGSKANNLTFGMNCHTAWEEFQGTISTKNYQTVIAGTKYPKRSEFRNDDMWNFASTMAEKKRHSQS